MVKNKIKVGVAERIITPKESVPFGEVKWCGYSIGVHDDIFTKALFIEEGEKKFLLVISDVMLIFRQFVENFRKEISKVTGLKENFIMIAATQNHSAPAMYGGNGWELPNYKGSWGKWFDFYQKQLIEVTKEACSKTQEIKLKISQGKAEEIAGNRRPLSKTGKVIMTWHRPKKEEITDWGEEDSTVTLFRFDKKDGNPLAMVFHFNCHPNCAWATRKISSDFYGIACQKIKNVYPDTIPIFLNGACGDIDPTKYMKIPKEVYNAPTAFEKGRDVDLVFNDIERFGDILGSEILRIAEKGEEIFIEKIMIKSSFFHVKLRQGAPVSVDTYLELQAIALEDKIVFLGIPGEPFLKIGNEIKNRSPFPYTFIIGHANGYSGYIPTANDYSKGGYGVGVFESPLEEGIGEKLIKESLKLLEKLKLKQ